MSVTWMEFAVGLVDTLAWPLLAFGVFFVLKDSLTRALDSGRLKRLSAGVGGLQLESWDEQFAEAKVGLAAETEELGMAELDLESEKIAGTPYREEMRSLARISPRAAILESFARLETLLRDATAMAVVSSRPVSLRTLGRVAEKSGLWTSEERSVFEDLIPLRSAEAHGVPRA